MDVPENPFTKPAELDLYFRTESLLAGMESFVCTIRTKKVIVPLVFFSFLLSSEVDAAMLMLAHNLLMECDALDGRCRNLGT